MTTSAPRLLATILLAFAIITDSAASQAPLASLRQQVLRGDRAAAEQALRGIDGIDDPTRALLQAATLPVAERAMAMHQVARIHAAHAAADVAILAGCAALLSSQGHGRLVPGVEAPQRSRKLPKGFDVPALVRGFRELIPQRRAAGGDTTCLDDAAWMLPTLSVSEVVDTVRRVRAGTRLPVPSPLAEDMTVRYFPFDLDRPLIAVYRDCDAEPIDGGRLPKGAYDQTIAPPPPGTWVVELATVEGSWSRLERLVVSDLALVTQSFSDQLVVMATLEGERARPATGAALTLTTRRRAGPPEVLEARTDDRGLAVFRLRQGSDRIRSLRLDARHGQHTARLTPSAAEALTPRDRRFRTHTIVDRPLYRPGETVHGRVLLREEVPGAGDASGSVAIETRVVRDRRVEVHLWPGTRQEVVLPGRTDASGVFAFRTGLRLSAPLGGAQLQLVFPDDPLSNGKPKTVTEQRLFEVQEFRRPVILSALELPAAVAHDAPWQLKLRCRYAAGPPAAGLRATVRVTAAGLQHRTSVLLDEAGERALTIHTHELPLPPHELPVSVAVAFHSPDGQIVRKRAATVVRGTKAATPQPRHRSFTMVRVGEPVAAGQPLRVRLTGRPFERVLLTTVRDVPVRSAVVTLDAGGAATVSIETTPADFPGLQLVASLDSGRPPAPALTYWERIQGNHAWQLTGDELDVSDWWYPEANARARTFALAAPGPAIEVAFEHADELAPGARAQVAVRATRGGQPVAATVAVTVVDETLYGLRPDRNPSPLQALQPVWTSRFVPRADGTGQVASPWHILGRLLRRGTLEAPEEEEAESAFDSNQWNTAIGLGGGAGGKYGGRGGFATVRTRKDFRPTAHFVGDLVTDAAGRATFSFTLPDDLTRWRITAFVVDDTFRGRKAVSHLQTRLPVSVTPVLPRVLRSGDEVDVTVTTGRQDTERAAGQVELRSSEAAAVAVRDPARQSFAVEGQAPHQATFHLRAAAPREVRLTARAQLGPHGDAAEHRLPVLPDLVVRPVTASALLAGQGTLALPRDGGAARPESLRLLGNRDALLHEAAGYLAGYPYGCVEQVLSRLTPLFLAARATRLRDGGTGPSLTEAQALRLEAGMVALRSHQVSTSAGFRWWRGDTVDRRMTALVLHALQIAREAGIDPERYGVRMRCGARGFTRQSDAIVRVKGRLAPPLAAAQATPTLADGELVAALLRYDPAVINHRRATRAILDADQDLPAGMLARIGLALLAAGDRPGAETALRRVLRGERVRKPEPRRGVRHPLERIGARAAHALELVLRLDPKHERRPALVGQLLALFRDGRFGSTYSTAAALHALALDASLTGHRPDQRPLTVRVRQGDRQRTYTLQTQNGFLADCALTGDAPVQITVDGGREVHAVLRGGIREVGTAHAGWSTPLRVTRTLHTVSVDAAGEESRSPVPFDRVPHGRTIELAIDVACDEDVSYLVLDCPLPAGFEVLGPSHGLERRDDRFVQLIPELRAGERVAVRVQLIAAHQGSVAWPPAVVQAMYQPDMTGGSPGARLTVIPPPPTDADAGVPTPLLTKAVLDERVAAAVAAVRDSRDPSAARQALYDLRRLFYDQGRRALLPHVDRLIRRFSGSPRTLLEIHDTVAALPAARAARAAALAGRADALGFLLLACRGAADDAGARWLPILRSMLTDDEFGGLSVAQRRPLLVHRFAALVGNPWRATALAKSTRDHLLHSDGPDVAPELQAWTPVLQAAVALLHSAPSFATPGTELPTDCLQPFEIEFGAAPGASFRYAGEVVDDLRWRLIAPLLAKGVQARLDWLDTIRGTTDRDRLLAAYRSLHASITATTDHDAIHRLLCNTPRSLCEALVPEHLALLAHEHAAVRWSALRALPDSQRQQVPEAVLLRAFEDSDGDLQPLASLGSRGVDLVRRWLEEDRAFLEPGPTAAFLAPRHLAGLSLDAIRRLADPDTIHTVRRALAAGAFTVAELQRQLHDHALGPWRVCLVEALARRGATGLQLPADDPLRPVYERLLAAARGDVAATLEIDRRLRADDGFRRGDRRAREQAMPTYLRAAHIRSLAGSMRAEQYLAWHGHLDREARAQVRRRFGLADWRYLLGNARGDALAALCRQVPAQFEGALLPVLLELTRRPEARPAAAARILQAAGGSELLREKLVTPALPGAARRALATLLFASEGRPVAWLTDAGEPVRFAPYSTASVGRRIARGDATESLTPPETELRGLLLRRRGVLVPPALR